MNNTRNTGTLLRVLQDHGFQLIAVVLPNAHNWLHGTERDRRQLAKQYIVANTLSTLHVKRKGKARVYMLDIDIRLGDAMVSQHTLSPLLNIALEQFSKKMARMYDDDERRDDPAELRGDYEYQERKDKDL